MPQSKYARTATTVAIVTGSTAVAIYLAWSFLPLPGTLNRLLHFAFGPLLVCAFAGIYFFLERARSSFLHLLAGISGGLAGAMFTLMTVVQASFLDYAHPILTGGGRHPLSEGVQAAIRATNRVQLGIDVVWDIFITLATVLVGIALWQRRKNVSRVFGAAGVAVGAATLVLNLLSFPIPPSASGLVDLGPAVGGWFGAFCIYMVVDTRIRNRASAVGAA